VLQVRDDKNLLVVRFSLSVEKVETLKKSQFLFLPMTEEWVENNLKGSYFVVKNCWVLAVYGMEIIRTTEIKKDLNGVNQRFKRNKHLFEEQSNALRIKEFGQ
jgi:hypothetical protein